MHARLLPSLVFLIVVLPVFGQQDPTVDAGFRPYGAFQGAEIDSVNLENGNLILHIPLISYPQRGGVLKLSVSTHYNNVNWVVNTTTNPVTGKVTQSWKLVTAGVGVLLDQATKITQYLDDNQLSGYDAISITTADGTSHILENADTYASSGTDWRSLDASGYLYHTVNSQSDTTYGVDATGVKTIWTSAASVTLQDPNGNQTVQSTNGTWVDTIGRQLPATLYSKYQPGYFSTTSTTNYSGCINNNASSAGLLNLPGYAGGTFQLKLCNMSYTFNSNMHITGINDTTFTGDGLHSILLPNGTSWIFDYDSQGNLSKVTYPTGGSISYTWATQPSGHIILTSRTVNDGTTSAAWNYNGGTVTDPNNNDTVHSFSLSCNPTYGSPNDSDYVESETDYYSGTGSSRTLLKKIVRSYSGIADMWSNLPGPLFPACMNTVLTGITTTYLDTGETSQTTFTPDNAGGSSLYFWETNGSSAPVALTFGQPVSTIVKNFGPNSPGVTIRQTSTTYEWQSNGNFLLANLLSRVATSKILDGSGNLCAETDYSYDGSSPESSGVTTGMGTAASVRGNVSSTTRQLSSNACQPNAGWTPVTTTTTVYDTGMPYQVTDPGGHTTTYKYSTSYQGAYLTETDLPSTSNSSGSFSHSTSGTYDFNTGLVTSYTDQNGNVSHYNYDTMERMVSAVMPDSDSSGNHGETDFYYPDAVTIERKQRLQGSTWTDEYIQLVP